MRNFFRYLLARARSPLKTEDIERIADAMFLEQIAHGMSKAKPSSRAPKNAKTLWEGAQRLRKIAGRLRQQ